MKTVAIAAAGILVGAAISYILSAATIRRLRSRLRAKHSTTTPRKGIGAMNLILAVVGVTLISFTIAMIQIYRETGGVPDTLITCVFAVCGGECGVMGWIKTNKDKAAEAAKADGSGNQTAPMDPPTEREEPPDVGL